MNKFVTDPARTSYRKPKPPKGKEKKPNNSKQNNPLSKVRIHIQSTRRLPTEISTSTLLSLFSLSLFLVLGLPCLLEGEGYSITVSQYLWMEGEAELLLRT